MESESIGGGTGIKIPDAHRQEVEHHVLEWLKLGVIQPARSRYNSPIFAVMKNNNIANAIAQAVFNNNFSLGVGFDAIISEAKKWLRKNVFTAELILKQLDLSGVTLNYKGISILNNVEAT